MPLQSLTGAVPGKRLLHTGGRMWGRVCAGEPVHGVINAFFPILISVVKSSCCIANTANRKKPSTMLCFEGQHVCF